MSYRSDVEALAAREAALAREVAEKSRELASAARLLDEARQRARLPILDNIRVATPCHASWNQMIGDERARVCLECSREVFNISGLTRDEAEDLIIEKEGELCVRYYQRADGTILLADCEVGKQQKRRRRLFAAGAAATLAGGAGFIAHERERPERLERAHDIVENPQPVPPPPAPPVTPQMREYPTQGVPPIPSAEERLRYKQLKKQKRVSR